jgi:hypothetical protein
MWWDISVSEDLATSIFKVKVLQNSVCAWMVRREIHLEPKKWPN